ANPAPPVGPALGQHGVNIMEFCKAYNAATESQRGNVVPVEISVYEDRSFDFKLKTPPAAKLLLKAASASKGSGEPHRNKIGSVTMDQVKEIARTKESDLNSNDIDAAAKVIAGTARSIGIEVTDWPHRHGRRKRRPRCARPRSPERDRGRAGQARYHD